MVAWNPAQRNFQLLIMVRTAAGPAGVKPAMPLGSNSRGCNFHGGVYKAPLTPACVACLHTGNPGDAAEGVAKKDGK